MRNLNNLKRAKPMYIAGDVWAGTGLKQITSKDCYGFVADEVIKKRRSKNNREDDLVR